MRTPIHPGIHSRSCPLLLAGSIVALIALAVPTAPAATRTKANNNFDLSLPASWDSLPGSADIAQWTSTVTAANTPLLGADLSWGGIKIVGPTGLVTLGAGNTLTLGAAGIDLSSATQSLTLNCGLTLQGKQAWSAAAGRTLNVAGTFTRTGAVVDFTNFNASAALGTLANEASGILGPWAVTGATTSLNYVKSIGGAISAYTAQSAATAADLSNVTNPAVNYTFGAGATQLAAITGNTLRFTGSGAVLANAGFTTTLNGLMNAGSGALTISGVGNLEIGTNRELVITANAQTTTISSIIADSSGGPSSVTYSGAGNLTLSAVNTYSGGTTVTAGTINPHGNGSGAARAYLGTGTVTLNGGTTLKPTDAVGQPVDLNNAFLLNGGAVSVPVPFGGGTDLHLRGTITGTGGLSISGGTRWLALYGTNTFSGGVILNDGNQLRINTVGAMGTGTLSLGNSSAGTLRTLTNLSSGQVPNTIDLTSGRVLTVDTSSGGINLAGMIQNTGGLIKIGNNTLTLSGVNTYAGTTTVSLGKLALATNLSLGQGPLVVATGATVALNYSGTRRVSSLSLGGVAKVAGTYGSTASSATNKDNTFFDVAYAGVLTVGPPGAATTTTLALTSGSSPSAVGASLTFTATVAGATPTGNVVFYDGATALAGGTIALNGSFQAAYTTTSLTSGSHSITAQYVGNATNEPSGSAVLPVQVAYPADILTFAFPGLPATTITGTNISVTVPYATNVTALAPTYTLFPGATCLPASGSTQNFTNPVHYIVTGADSSTKDYTVTVNKTPASTAKDILTFVFPGLPAPTIGTNTISLSVPFGTPVNALSPTYTVSPLAVPDATNPSGSTRDFASAKNYIITAEDGTQKTYTVTVTKAAASTACDITACNFPGLGAATIIGTNITLFVAPSQPVTALAPTFTFSPLATLSPVSGTARDFTSAKTYICTAENGTTSKTYTVTVQSYQNWSYNASLFILTTPDGANITSGASETNFPLLVRLNSGNFNFSQAQSDGRDIRFASPAGAVLSYQIEQWDSVNGTAAVWVKIPSIAPNARQEIKMYWGKPDATSESSGSAVFNSASGFASVLHMNETLNDVVGNTTPTNLGTTLTTGAIGKGRNFTSGNGIQVGTNITTFPTGSGSHSSEVWIRASASSTTILGWGHEEGQGKVVMQLANPPHINMDCYFGGGNVSGASTFALSQWVHVAHTFTNGAAKIYVNGVLDGTNSGGVMNINSPATFFIGGWDGYNYVGDIDEVRISNVTRSANWIKLEYENQKALQTLVGNLVQPGSTFSVTPTSLMMNEGASATLSAQAGGAQKVYWIEKRNGVDTVLATDQFTLPVTAGRATGDQSYVIQFKAIYPTGNQTVDIPVTITEFLPDPVFTLIGPSTWDGRQTITVTPDISNLATLQAKNVANLTYNWSATGVAVTKTITAGTPTVPGVLTLTRSQGSGPLTVTLVLNNGGALISSSKTITVQEPATDAWVQRTPGATEKPVTGQFFARDDTGFGKIHHNGTGAGTTPVYLKVFTTDTGSDVPYGATLRQTPVGGAYAFAVPIAAGKVTYKVEFGTTTGGIDTPSGAAITNLICGDVYMIEGQSNAEATNDKPDNLTTNPWIHTYRHTITPGANGWGKAVKKGSDWWVGYWGMDLAVKLSSENAMPICIINGAAGGTRIDQHQPNPADHSQAGSLHAIYAKYYNRLVAAKLTHGVRAVLWHQGEQDQGSEGPDGDYDYKFYQQYFVDMSAAWKLDFPNIKNYYVFQIWPEACGDTSRNDQLREVQRTLPKLFSNMRIMTTVGIIPGASCHYEPDGYKKFSDLIGPLVEQDTYGYMPGAVLTAANLKKAYFTTAARNEITLEFDQNMTWINATKGLFYLDGAAGQIASGSVTGKVVKLTLTAASSAKTITYLKGIGWDDIQANLLYGSNAIAALTFADVALTPVAQAQSVNTSEDTATAIPLVATDTNGFALTYTVVTQPTHGILSGTAPNVIYTPTANYHGTDSFTFKANNGTIDSAPATVSITVTPVNDGPVAVAQAVGAVEGIAKAITLAATDVEGSALTYAIVTQPAHGTLSGTPPAVVYTSAAGFNGTDSFTFKANDGVVDSAAVTVTVGPILSPYANWANGPAQGLTPGVNDGPLDDPDYDGIVNLLEFALAGAPMGASQVPLPTLSQSTGPWTFAYNRSVASRPPGTTQIVEYGDGLSGWTPLTIPLESATYVTITPQGETDRVEVTLPALGAKGFARLKVSQ